MEHREPPPAVAEDSRTRSVAPAASDRLALPSPALRRAGLLRLARPRVGVAFALLGGILVGSYLVYLAARTARSWLADQPAYQLPFRAIVLDPPPPTWYRGGPAEFLEDVRRRAWMPETIPLLNVREAELRRAFEQNPWTEEVQQITYRPLGVAVRLAYRRPVALVETSGSKTPYLLDGSAVLLPLEDVDQNELRQGQGLITIKGDDLQDPRDPQVGLTWKPRAGLADVAPGNDLIPAAAKLADFLLAKMRTIDVAANPALDIRYINPIDPGHRGLFLWNAESNYILWGRAPGEEGAEGLVAEEKWEKLRAWNQLTRDRKIPAGDFWKITPEGVIHREFDSQGASTRPPRRDRATIPAKAPGQSQPSLSHSG